ncbi:MAG: TIR domain-containing protein [Geobacter sp.]|nr:TIR domain-containing protein [Geobacter sp.]
MSDSGEIRDVGSASTSIFISYRRKDTGGYTGRLYDRLTQLFDAEDIFYDQSGIESGEDFPIAIQNALDSAEVILVIIGPDWLSEENRKRLNDAKDFVRHEVMSALHRKETEIVTKPLVVPVLVGGAGQLSEADLGELSQLALIQSHAVQGNLAEYNLKVEELCKIISNYSRSWTAKHSNWMLACLANKKLSSANFGQDLTVLHPDSHYIQRHEANKTMDTWWSGWKEHHRPFVLLGEEGDGKSWALTSWIAKTISLAGQQMPVIFISATKVSNADDFITEMAEAMARVNESVSAMEWKNRLKLFLRNSADNIPQIVLVLDGLNERPSIDWRDLFDNYLISPYRKNIALLISCRTGYWHEHLAKEYDVSVSVWKLSPFSDGELDQALTRHHLTRAFFSDRVLKLVAKPRYFDMAVRLKDQLEESGDDVTIDRLIYEDWKDRIGRKRLPSVKISHAEFQAIITDVVQKFGERVSIKQLAQTLATYGNQAEIRNELVSSGILKEIAGGKFEVAANPLILGLGLLLASEIEESGKDDLLEIEEIIAERLGQHPDSDRLVQICAMALFHSLLTEGFPDVGCRALFRNWISGRNLDEADSERVSAYFPLKPHIYFQIMEDLWGNFGNYREVEDHLMSALLQRHNFEHVKAEMITTFERWLSFVHPLGYRGWFERDESKKEGLIKEVEERLGQQVEIGAMELFGHRIEIVADQRLLQLAKVAESVISHFDREPFVQGLCNGAIATAVMGGSNVDYRWIVRTAPGKVQTALLMNSGEFMATCQSLAFRVADYLLFWICSEDSIALRETIPEELSFRSWHKKFWEEHRNNSTNYLWSEDNYLDCLQKAQLAPIVIAENLREVAINPLCTLPEEFATKIDTASSQIDLTQIRSHLGQTIEDIALRDMEPALCAYKPERYAELFRKLTEQLNGSDYLSCRLLASKLYEHMPIFTNTEHEQILKVWRGSLAAEGSETESAELTLFPMVVFDRPADEQFLLLRERGSKTGYFSKMQARYRKIESTSLAPIIRALDMYDGSRPEECYAQLEHLAKAINSLDESLRESLLKLFQSDNSIIRYLCIEIICNTNDQLAAQKIIGSGWKIHGENCDYENGWGSILLARFANDISFEELACRISLKWLGYAVKERGNRQEEVADYALRLHVIWTRIAKPTESAEDVLRHVKISLGKCWEDIEDDMSINLNENIGIKWTKFTWGGTSGAVSNKSLDPDAVEAEWDRVYKKVLEVYAAEKKRGNHWIDTSFSNGNLDAVVASEVLCWREWIQPILDGTTEGRHVLAFCQGLYESLCATLLNHEPETGAKLFEAIMKHKTTRIVDSFTDIQNLLFSLFDAEESPPVLALWDEHLTDCDSDKSLSELACLAQSCEKAAWLDAKIQSLLESDLDYDKARGLRLLGFSVEDNHSQQLRKWIDAHGRSWLMDVAKDALESSKRNSWARIWIERFIAEEDRVKSWAAFRLFLRCVDKRFWIWGYSLIYIDKLPDWKTDAYKANIGTIMGAIKENEKKLKDTFIGHEVKENQLWPWMKRYL